MILFLENSELSMLRRLVYEEITNVSYWAALPEEHRREAPAIKAGLEELLFKIDFELGKEARYETVRSWQVQQLSEGPQGGGSAEGPRSHGDVGLDTNR